MRFQMVFTTLILFFSYCKEDWIRKLPPDEKKTQINIQGVWAKKAMPISPINSNYYKNEWKEEIEFHSNTFIKKYESIDKIGDKKIQTKVVGKGEYKTKGNWILLITKQIKRWSSDQNSNDSFQDFDHKLLYYYDKKNNVILPMIYDVAYKEKNFGVRDGVNTPYDENDKNFLKYIKIYTYKEYQAHAYFKQ